MTSDNPSLYIDPLTNDIYVDSLGSTRLTATLTEEVAQRLSATLKLFLGEWFLDTRLGLPYFRDVLIKNPDLSTIRSMFQNAITADAGVESLVSLDLEFDSQARNLAVTFVATLVSGELLQSTTTSVLG
jgi:hypothetical protein